MSGAKRVPAEALVRFAAKVLTTLGADAERARVTAEVLAAADLRGISSHGVAGGTGLRELVERIQKGGIDPKSEPVVRRNEGWAVAVMDARGGIGPAAAMDAARLAGDMAERYGVGKVYVRNANHFGAACVYVEALIERGLAGRATCTSGAWMKPTPARHVSCSKRSPATARPSPKRCAGNGRSRTTRPVDRSTSRKAERP